METPTQERKLDLICRINSAGELKEHLKCITQGLNSRVITFEELKTLFGIFDKKTPEEFNRLPLASRLAGLGAIAKLGSQLTERGRAIR